MTYQTISKELTALAEKAKEIGENLNNELTKNMKQYIGDMLTEKNTRVDSEAKAQLSTIHSQAQEALDTGIKNYQEVLDITYFKDINSNQAAELEMIEKSNLDIDELRAYFRKFSDNQTALRRLEKIADDKGFMVTGRGYRGEMDFMRVVKNAGQGVVDAIYSSDPMRLNIAVNYLTGKVAEYETFAKKEIQVIQK